MEKTRHDGEAAQARAGQTLEKIVERSRSDVGSRVYVLSEMGYDSAYFNPQAYSNLLKFMSEDKDISGIIIDGALTRLDRPEYLNDELSYWTKTEEECMAQTENIPNKRQYKEMMETQLKILERRISELKESVPQAKKIVLSLDSDDIQYTVSAMVNEMLIRGQHEMQASISDLRKRRNDVNAEHKKACKEYERVGDSDAKKSDALKRKIASYESRISRLDEDIKNKSDERNLYREKKARPAHQFFTARFLKKLYSRYQDICDRLGVTLVTKQSVLDFDGLVVDYAHSRHATWAVLKRRDSALLSSAHGKMDAVQKRALELAKEAGSNGIDVILESGHAGIGYKQLQKVKDHPDETNFRNQSAYSPKIGGDCITLVMALPFEDQARIARFVKGDEPIRLSGGKAMNTRKHAAIDRYNNDGVSGVTILTKDGDGIVGTEWIQYRNFADGSVLNQPDEYSIICASSDEHICSPEENIIARDGWIALYDSLLRGTGFRGKAAFARGYLNGGDAAEANSRKWNHRYHYKKDPQHLLRENIALLSGFNGGSVDEIVKLAMKMADDARGGSVESMAVVLERVADYYESFLTRTMESSRLKWAHVSTTGNHADEILKDLGLRESDFFAQRLKARGIGTYEVGKPGQPYGLSDARVFLGGYSNARVLNIPDYGLDIDGNVLFGPINLVVQHDPKGSRAEGVTGAGKSCGADVSLAGHTHDNFLRLYRREDNVFGVAYKLATMQGVSPTEKYYANSVPRTQASHCLVMPMQGDFSEKAVPIARLQELGMDSIMDIAGKAAKGK